jgi:hypothetical protein
MIVATSTGHHSVDAAAIRTRVEAVQPIVLDLAARDPRPRPERLSGIHNPWGHAAVLATAWPFLDLCEDASIVEAVACLIGPDVVLWDSELHLEAGSYLRFVEGGREGLYWPATPLAGAVVLVTPLRTADPATCLDLAALPDADFDSLRLAEPLYVIRYMPATSLYARDPHASSNRAAMEAQPLINYTTRPLWLVAGEDRAGNDFVTGFSPQTPRWAGNHMEQH